MFYVVDETGRQTHVAAPRRFLQIPMCDEDMSPSAKALLFICSKSPLGFALSCVPQSLQLQEIYTNAHLEALGPNLTMSQNQRQAKIELETSHRMRVD